MTSQTDSSNPAQDTPTRLAFRDWMPTIQRQMEEALAKNLPHADAIPARLHQAMRYATLDGGKRVRPLLAFAAGELTNAPISYLEVAASAVEMIHAYSLVHDDLPCMDNDVLRRGKPTCHIEYDEATALLVGDSLQTRAFEILSHAPFENQVQQIEIIKLLAHATGSQGMAGGQAIDLASVGIELTQPELELMHALKTGALIRAAVLMGAQCGTPLSDSELASLDHYAKRAGLLFQVVDDILDCTENTATLGKTAGKDADADKPTYVSLMGLERARQFAEELHAQAIESLSRFGSKATRLIELTQFITKRKF